MPFNLQHPSVLPLSPSSLFRPKAQESSRRSPPHPETQSNASNQSAITDADSFTASLVTLAEIGEHTAMLAHEMRSPLSVILNALRLCEQMPLPTVARQRLTLALEATEQINHLVNDVLTFARHARFPNFHWSDLELNALMQEVLQLIAQAPIIQHRQIHLETSETPVWVRGDRDKLKQVLTNLLVNFCESSDETATLCCRIELVPEEVHALLRINSRPPQTVPPTAFSQHSQPYYHHFDLGLGLLLVQRLINAHGGTFWLESKARGAAAVIQLPTRPSNI